MVGDRPLDTEAGVNAGVLSVLLDMEDRFPAGRCDLRILAAEKLIDLLT
jgi:phosphoglycolate phosphatase-like HAD superfamily hydrolase